MAGEQLVEGEHRDAAGHGLHGRREGDNGTRSAPLDDHLPAPRWVGRIDVHERRSCAGDRDRGEHAEDRARQQGDHHVPRTDARVDERASRERREPVEVGIGERDTRPGHRMAPVDDRDRIRIVGRPTGQQLIERLELVNPVLRRRFRDRRRVRRCEQRRDRPVRFAYPTPDRLDDEVAQRVQSRGTRHRIRARHHQMQRTVPAVHRHVHTEQRHSPEGTRVRRDIRCRSRTRRHQLVRDGAEGDLEQRGARLDPTGIGDLGDLGEREVGVRERAEVDRGDRGQEIDERQVGVDRGVQGYGTSEQPRHGDQARVDPPGQSGADRDHLGVGLPCQHRRERGVHDDERSAVSGHRQIVECSGLGAVERPVRTVHHRSFRRGRMRGRRVQFGQAQWFDGPIERRDPVRDELGPPGGQRPGSPRRVLLVVDIGGCREGPGQCGSQLCGQDAERLAVDRDVVRDDEKPGLPVHRADPYPPGQFGGQVDRRVQRTQRGVDRVDVCDRDRLRQLRSQFTRDMGVGSATLHRAVGARGEHGAQRVVPRHDLEQGTAQLVGAGVDGEGERHQISGEVRFGAPPEPQIHLLGGERQIHPVSGCEVGETGPGAVGDRASRTRRGLDLRGECGHRRVGEHIGDGDLVAGARQCGRESRCRQ